MSTPENTSSTNTERKTFSFAPRPASQSASTTNLAVNERQRRTIRNLLIAVVFVLTGTIISALIISSEEDIKVQVTAEPSPEVSPSSELELEGLTFKGITQEGNDFIILADRAVELSGQPELVKLISPRARIDSTSGNPMTVRSLNGSFDRNNDRVDLEGRVVIVRPDIGYTLMTDQAVAYLGTGMMTSDREVRGFSPRGRVRSDGIVISEGGQHILFTGSSTLRLLTQQSN